MKTKKIINAICCFTIALSAMPGISNSSASEVVDLKALNLEEGSVYLIGDLDGSEVVDVTDLTLYSLYLIGDIELEDSQKMCADTNMDALLNICDLANFGAYCAKKVPEGSANMIGGSRVFSNKGIERPTKPDDYEVPPSDITGEVVVIQPSPTPAPTVTPTSTPAAIDRPQMPEGYILPVNRENNTFDYATLSGKAYTKRCVHTFDESTLDEKTLNAFFESTAEKTGVMASAKTVSGISSEEMFLLKCGNEEGKYYVFLNESLTEEEAKKIYDQFGITEYTTPEPAALTEPEQPIPTPEPTVTPTSTPAYIEREPFPEGYIMPVNREDNTYDYATYKENTYTKRCVHVFDETQFDEKKVNPFVRSNNGGVMEFARTVKGISSDDMFLVKCGTEEGKYFVFLNESLTEEEAKQIYDQFGITEYTTPEPKTFPEPEQPIPTPAPTAAPVDGTDYSKVERDPEAIKSGFSGLREATEEEIAASKNQPDKDKMPVPTAAPVDGTDYSKVERDPEAIENGFSGAREATEEQIAASKNQPDKD